MQPRLARLVGLACALAAALASFPSCAAARSTSVRASVIQGYFNLTAKLGSPPSAAQLEDAYAGIRRDLATEFADGSETDVVVVHDATPLRGFYQIEFGFVGGGDDGARMAAAVEDELNKERNGVRSKLEDGGYTKYLSAAETGESTLVTIGSCPKNVYVADGAACPSGGGGGSNAGAVVGAVFGVIFGVAVVVGGLVWWKRRAQHRRNLEYTLQGDGLLDDSLGGGYRPPRVGAGSFADLEGLPEGWIQQVDDHGNVYYYDSVNDISSWEKPTA